MKSEESINETTKHGQHEGGFLLTCLFKIHLVHYNVVSSNSGVKTDQLVGCCVCGPSLNSSQITFLGCGSDQSRRCERVIPGQKHIRESLPNILTCLLPHLFRNSLGLAVLHIQSDPKVIFMYDGFDVAVSSIL